MANTYADYTGDGSETDFAINFDYIKTSHVAVEVNEGPAGGTNTWVRKTLGSDYTVVTSPTKQVVFTSAPANLVRVRVLRDSDANVGIVDFANGSVLTETELDNAYNHNRYLAQEAEEGASGGGFTKNLSGQYDADGLRIENLAAPDSDDDAANKSYVDTATAAAVATEASARISGDNDQVSKTGDTMSGNLAMGGNKVTGLGSPGTGTDAANKTYVDDTVASVTAGTIPDGTITTAKLADDAVTAAKLDNTTVTPGSYTNTDITVDENGRITAASNGSSGAGATNLGVTHNAENVDVTSSTGDDITLNAAVASVGATPGTAGVMTDGDKEKLDGLVSNATHTGDVTGSTALTIANGVITHDKISTTDTVFNISANNEVGIGRTAVSGYGLGIAGGVYLDNSVAIDTYAEGDESVRSLSTQAITGGYNTVAKAIKQFRAESSNYTGAIGFSYKNDGFYSTPLKVGFHSSVDYSTESPNRNIYHILCEQENVHNSGPYTLATGNPLLQVIGNGDVANKNNSYGSTSDSALKKDIADANSQWTDIKNVSVKNYKLKSETEADSPVYIGVVAQDLEAAGMNGLVDDSGKYKTVKYSILYMKAIKALQEAMDRIEALEAKVESLQAQ